MSYLSGYRLMWMLVMFDLPVTTKADMKAATRFRNFLLDNAFGMAQFSVYMRSCTGKEQVERFKELIKQNLLKKGKVNILEFTDKQYGNMSVFFGKNQEKTTKPKQFVLFQPSIETFLTSEN